MEPKKEKIFANGFIAKRPKEGAPEFIKLNISVKVEEAVAFLQKYAKADGWLNMDLKSSKEGKLYLELNTWKKKAPAVSPTPPIPYPAEVINPDDIPF